MCACYFRAQGENFDVDTFLSESPWQSAATVFRKGEPKSRGSSLREYSLFSIQMIDDDNSTVAQQMTACRSFISDHRQEFERLQRYSEAQSSWFSLAYYLMIGEVYAIAPYFDKDFLSDILSVGAEFEFNVFCCSVE